MAESSEELQQRLVTNITPGFQGRLLDRGLARGLIWRDGILPQGAPQFAESLTEDLLDYAHTVLALALRLRVVDPQAQELTRAFTVAGEAIEAAVHRGVVGQRDRGFNRVSAAVAFHLARFAARAYSILPSNSEHENLSPAEMALVQLLRRSLDEMHDKIRNWVLSDLHTDESIAERFAQDNEFGKGDAINLVLTCSFMRGLALFDHALTTGLESSAEAAKQKLSLTAEVAEDLNAVSHWWTSTLAFHLIDDLWKVSLHKRIPTLSPEDPDSRQWNDLRLDYIHRLRVGKRSAIELWPSQLTAVKRSLNPIDDLVVALPTSAGKTRIAELCILRALASDRRVIYVTPLRALSAQIERDLAETFLPLGFSVSALYGSAGIESGDAKTLREGKIVVSTPEKLDFALRNDPTLIDDVGLIVFDEGHMLGPNEREVRYEALVQRIVRRADRFNRRVVCLSALFPSQEKMTDLVAWIRQDEPGEAIHLEWRPTRQRFGTLTWRDQGAKLEVQVEEEKPYLDNFISPMLPPEGSKRRRGAFPADKDELTLAAAWKFVEHDKQVLIYCVLRASVEKLGKLILKSIRHKVLLPLREASHRIRVAMTVGNEWLGKDHPAVRCLEYGIALHHGGLPRPFLNEVEALLRSNECPLTIASPTLAQGLNIAASVLLVPSIWRNKEIIPAAEFANVSGRAGRAFVDLEGMILHVVWETSLNKRRWAIANWNNLIATAKAPEVVSGLLQLSDKIFRAISIFAQIPLDEVVNYVTGQNDVWDFNPLITANNGVDAEQWTRDLASLDSAFLALLESATLLENIDSALNVALEGSLFVRQLSRFEDRVQGLLKQFIAARIKWIWVQTTSAQRKGYHFAGVGLSAGKFLDAHLQQLVELLFQAEYEIFEEDGSKASIIVIEFARLVFQIEPFKPNAELSSDWEKALNAWLLGSPAVEVKELAGIEGVDVLQDAFAYRLPWAIEAVRVHANAVAHEYASGLTGLAAMAVEVGSVNRSVITLLRAGLASREAAYRAVESVGATFGSLDEMNDWLASEKVQQLNLESDWPTAQSRYAWLKFVHNNQNMDRKRWHRVTQVLTADWADNVPSADAYLVIEPHPDRDGGMILAPDLVNLGNFRESLRNNRSYIVRARIGSNANQVLVEYFGPER